MNIRNLIYYIGTILIVIGFIGVYMIESYIISVSFIGILLVIFSDKKLWVKLITIILLPIISILGFLFSIFAFSEPL